MSLKILRLLLAQRDRSPSSNLCKSCPASLINHFELLQILPRTELGIFIDRSASSFSDNFLKQIEPLIYETKGLFNGLSLTSLFYQDLLFVLVRFIAALSITLTLSDKLFD